MWPLTVAMRFSFQVSRSSCQMPSPTKIPVIITAKMVKPG